ncbi:MULTISPECIES: hypothetical protein [unclassified Pseudoclavibacter]|uniref:ORC-CDC6 family AAA ATPase n=1 Tax=unclassified Pseudoclavibacter TaxID=2615177 RepID=UPI0011B01C56|nr:MULTISPECIES: hypothetical protein [unclassified Pseudoclavibacter]
MRELALDTFNAKRLSMRQVAETFVMPDSFTLLAGGDHAYVIGPRGSGKTTLLRMLSGPGLEAWRGRDAERFRKQIDYATVFLPADELWASQTSPVIARAAFTAQMLYAFVESMQYRTRADPSVHLPAKFLDRTESELAQQCAEAWSLDGIRPGLVGLLEALDLFITRLAVDAHPLEQHSFFRADSLSLLAFGVRAFNRATREPGRRWALLLDEMELAPASIHEIVTSFVRGGSSDLVLKISMSPFDRYLHFYSRVSGVSPIPGHDFQTIYLSGQSRREIRRLTNGLWEEHLKARGFSKVPLTSALDVRNEYRDSRTRRRGVNAESVIREAYRLDEGFAEWLDDRGISPARLSELTYNQRSASVRKIVPLLVFRDSLLNFREGKPVRRSRKKSLEPFVGADAVTTILEGNPRWIKTAFAQMLNYYDPNTQRVTPGFQYDAVSALASRFESLLRVLPNRQTAAPSVPVIELVDVVSRYLNSRNTSRFNPDPPNGFTVDRRTPAEVTEAITLGLYAGAFVHVRDRRSPAVLTSFEGQRFRLAYLLGVREGKEFPLRLGKDVSLSAVIREAAPARKSDRSINELDLGGI